MTNIAKNAKITKVTRFQTQIAKKLRRALKCPPNIAKIAKVTRIFHAS